MLWLHAHVYSMSTVVALGYMDINTELSILTYIHITSSSKFLINKNNLHNGFP